MAPPKGTTNNPNGRPKKERALTDLLVKELSHGVELPDGTKVSGKKLLAQNVVNAITTGKVKFPKDAEESVISIKDWIDFVKWSYVHIDGSVKTEVDVTTNGKEINSIDGYDRAVSTLAATLREIVSSPDTKQDGSLDTTV
jgi:hypothetical protein